MSQFLRVVVHFFVASNVERYSAFIMPCHLEITSLTVEFPVY